MSILEEAKKKYTCTSGRSDKGDKSPSSRSSVTSVTPPSSVNEKKLPVSHPARLASRRVGQLLDNEPGLKYAAEVVDPNLDPVRIVIAIRDEGICELLVARDKFDPIRFLEMLEAAG